MAEGTLQIREANPEDVPVLVDYNCRMARETEGLALDRPTVERGVRAVFDDPARGFYLVAVVNDRVAGQLMVTFEWSDWRDGMIYWIQSVYVAPEFRRSGVFTALYQYLQQLARRRGVVGIRLYVEQENANAQRTYERLGMRLSHYRLMEQMIGREGKA